MNAVFAGLSGATGPLVSPHQPELMVHSAGAGWGPPAASLGWIPQTQGTSEARDLRPPPCNSPCLRSLFHLFPLCLWSSIPSLPLGFREHLVIPESGPNNFLVMGKPQSSHGSPRLPPLFPLAVPHSPCSSAGSSCVLQNSHWITSVIASRCEPQKHKGAMSSSLCTFSFTPFSSVTNMSYPSLGSPPALWTSSRTVICHLMKCESHHHL